MPSCALLSGVLLLVGCQPPSATGPDPRDDTASPTADPSPTGGDLPRLTVVGGQGGGRFAAGTEVHVWADVDPQHAIVTGWTGDAELLIAPEEWNSSLVMPGHDVSVRAVIDAVDAPIVAREYVLAAGPRTALVAAPSGPPVGIVLFFHGAAYSVDELRDNAAATLRLRLVRAGWVVVAAPSEREAASGTGGWNASLDEGANVDLQNVRALLAALRAEDTVSADAPVMAWGMSSGGWFAHTVGAILPADAVASYCAPGNADAIAATSAATAWYLAALDTVVPDGASQAEAFDVTLTGRGLRTDRYVHAMTPLYDARFTRVAGIDGAGSARLAAAIRDAGFVDDEDGWVVSGSVASRGLGDLDGAAALTADQKAAVVAEIEIMAADHELYDDVAARTVGFFEAVRSDLAAR